MIDKERDFRFDLDPAILGRLRQFRRRLKSSGFGQENRLLEQTVHLFSKGGDSVQPGGAQKN